MSEPGREPRAPVHSDRVSDDRRDGLAMFVIFIAAVLTATGAVALLALVGAWWMLGLAFGIHVLMTTLVVMTIVPVMNDRTSAVTERRVRSRRGLDVPRTGSRQPAADATSASLPSMQSSSSW